MPRKMLPTQTVRVSGKVSEKTSIELDFFLNGVEGITRDQVIEMGLMTVIHSDPKVNAERYQEWKKRHTDNPFEVKENEEEKEE